MRGLKSTIAMFLVLLGLGAYIYFVTWKDAEVSTENRVFASLTADDIQEVTVTSSGGETTTVRKDGTNWQVVSPVTAPAAISEVTAITSALGLMDTVRVVDEQPTDLAGFGLQPAKINVEFTSAEGKPSGQLLIGERSPTGAGVYAKRGDQPRVFLIPEYQGTTFDKATFDLRDKAVVTFDRGQVNGMDVDAGGRRLTFGRKDNNWTITSPLTASADFGSVEAVITDLEQLQMRSVAANDPTPADLQKFGLDKPAGTITLSLGSARATIAIGGAAEDGRVYMRDLSKPFVVTVDSTVAEHLKKGVDDYRRRDLFDFRAFNANQAEFTRGGDTYVFERVKAAEGSAQDSWRRISPTAGDVDRAKMDALLSGLADVRASEFRATTAGTGLDSPVMSIVVKFEDGKRENRASFGKVGAASFASVPGEPGAAVIDTQHLDDALKALDEISK